ncbi:MAG TPA: DUF4398 domain-containing protein [Polyangiaceae bacterium]|jgi:outer membrane protein OmpA-like peptidoglycan-associated protein
MKKLLVMSGAALLAACSASLPPPELVDARVAYAKASPNATIAPEAVLAARTALDRAERSYQKHGDTPHARTLAYVATRKSETAEVEARIAVQKEAVRRANGEIARIDRDRLREGARLPRDTSEALVYTAGALTRENQVRTDADQNATSAIDALRHVVPVQDRGEGFVVKISAPSAFDGEGTTLEDSAKAKLEKVAQAILRALPDAEIRIESHADSGRWGDFHDRAVAQKRADAVAAVLASCGLSRASITSVGYAPRHVPRDAADYDFHGLERRVDIVVSKPIALAASAAK